jgi:pyruvate dehydrogenase E2 component (dihydrolipoamide acetyltransferase)
MSLSKKEVPHVYFQADIVVDAALDRLDACNAKSDVKVTVSALFMRATALALREHPAFNAHWTDEGLLQLADVNIAIAVALEGGLIAPALLGADTLSVVETARALQDVVDRARAGKLRSQEITGGSFTLSNLGMFEVTSFYGIITPPQVGILTVGKTSERLKLVGRQVAAERVAVVALSADHRAVDGADAARFLGTIKRLLEDPELLEAPAIDS